MARLLLRPHPVRVVRISRVGAVGRRPLAVFLGIVAVVAGIVAVSLISAVGTDRTITVGTGPKGTLAYESAQRLVQAVSARGFDIEILETDQTGDLIDLLVDPSSPVDVTFVSELVDPGEYPTVNSLGTVYRLPYLFATWPAGADIKSIPEIRGSRIDLGPERSVRAKFAEAVLARYGITADNTTFLNLPTSTTREEVDALGVDVQSTDIEDARPFIVEGLASGELRMIPMPEAAAISRRVPSAEEVEIPYGSFALSPPVPAERIPTVAQLITVVANDRLSPASVYAIVQELSLEASPGTGWTDPGEFPNFADRQLPSNPYAVEFYSTGMVPWQFESLHPVLADSFLGLLVLGTLLLLFASIYSIFLPDVYGLWTGILRPRSEEKFISSIEAAVVEGREIPDRDLRRLDRILRERDAAADLRARAERLRPHTQEPS
jgi:TRAP-type uncharacterized transport system substrate-binding protein